MCHQSSSTIPKCRVEKQISTSQYFQIHSYYKYNQNTIYIYIKYNHK